MLLKKALQVRTVRNCIRQAEAYIGMEDEGESKWHILIRTIVEVIHYHI